MKITIYELLGLIKDGKAPKKISIRGNIFDSYSCSSIEYYYRSYDGTNWLDAIHIKLEDEVEILDEEDEFIDIEEIKHEYIYGLTTNEEKIDDRVSKFEDKINDLIKNQKKIIEKIK